MFAHGWEIVTWRSYFRKLRGEAMQDNPSTLTLTLTKSREPLMDIPDIILARDVCKVISLGRGAQETRDMVPREPSHQQTWNNGAHTLSRRASENLSSEERRDVKIYRNVWGRRDMLLFLV